MTAVLTVPDEVVIGFFSAVVLAQSGAIVALWFQVSKLQEKMNDIKDRQ